LEAPPSVVTLPDPPPAAAVHIATSMALAQVSDENAALRAQITEMAATMARLRGEVLAASEGELVKLALTIAERVIGRELKTDPTLVVDWAREGIAFLAAKDGVVIAVARDVRDEVPEGAWAGLAVEHRVQTDPQLAPGAVEVRTPAGTVATGAAARLEPVVQALGVGES
jgi:flagellar assembly protein FliH